MFAAHRRSAFLYHKALTFLPTPNPYPPFHHYQYQSQIFSLPFCSNASDSTSFAVSYLVHNFGFSPQSASKLCSTYKLRFKTAQKPDSVLNFFRNHGFSDSQIRVVIAKEPRFLSCDPSKRVLPKFQFFLSKGASTSDIVNLVSKTPLILARSLENHIVPTYQLVYRFLQSHKDTIACMIGHPALFSDYSVPHNIKLLIQNGVAVVQFLLNKGLRKQNASFTYPFTVSEKLFLDMYIKRFKNESSYLLKLYEEQLNLAHNRDKTGLS